MKVTEKDDRFQVPTRRDRTRNRDHKPICKKARVANEDAESISVMVTLRKVKLNKMQTGQVNKDPVREQMNKGELPASEDDKE